MAEGLPTQVTKYYATGFYPSAAFRYVFDVNDLKEEIRRLFPSSGSRRCVTSPLYEFEAKGNRKRIWNYGGVIEVSGDVGSKSLVIRNTVAYRDAYQGRESTGVWAEHTVTAEMWNGETCTLMGRTSEFKEWEKREEVQLVVKKTELDNIINGHQGEGIFLRIVVELKLVAGKPREEESWMDYPSASLKRNHKRPRLDLRRSDEKFCDITITCGEQNFKAHKLVLSAASPVFARMLDAPMKESTDGTIVMEYIESDTVQLLVDYIYAGECIPETSDTILELFYSAEKYELQGLKELLLEKMVETLNNENAVKFLSAALKIAPSSTAVKNMIAFCKPRFFALCALNPENRNLLGANLDLFCSANSEVTAQKQA